MKRWIVAPKYVNDPDEFAPFTVDAKTKEHAEIIASIMAPNEFEVIPAKGTHTL